MKASILTEKVRAFIINGLLEGRYKPGDKLPTEKEMMAISGTSRITVRRAYALLERSGIIVRKKKRGTSVAKSFRGSTQDLESVAVISTLRDRFSVDFIEAVENTCRKEEILAFVSVADESLIESQAKKAVSMASQGIKNLIFWGSDRRIDFGVFERLRILGVNMVFFDRVIPGPFADYVGLDNNQAMQLLFDEAVRRGCADFVFADIADMHVDSNDERRKGLMNLCSKDGFAFSTFEVPRKSRDQEKLESICRAHLEGKGKGTALVCVNDDVALSLCAFVPAGVRIFSVDGTEEALAKNIISCRQPIEKMAEASVKALKRQKSLGVKWVSRQYRFKAQLVRPVRQPETATQLGR